ncbi:hypothetical protein SEA_PAULODIABOLI_241 [Microbacterium phage PauloDiaboli]|nr:hypothetical protein SEA_PAULODIABOLI_241 [Microbacterium phage PauloDiaboli]QWY84048.1 hypothetical protein SEA_A3WALLY_241 [Microbacterium phage A3Wally]
MDEVLALQYRRLPGKRLQMIVLPYSFNVSAAALIRFLSPSEHKDPTEGWRIIPIIGMRMTLKINGLDDFVGDAMMKEIFESPWMRPEGLYMEAKGRVLTEGWDFGDLVADRVPRELLTRIHEQVDNWA